MGTERGELEIKIVLWRLLFFCCPGRLTALRPCSLAPLGFRGAGTEPDPFSLDTLSNLASSSLAKSLGQRLINVSCPRSTQGGRGGCCHQHSGRRGEREVSCEGLVTWSGNKATQHCGWTPAPPGDGAGRSLGKVRGRTPQARSPGCLASSPLFFPIPSHLQRLGMGCAFFGQSQAEVSKSWTLREHSRKSICGANL